MNPPVVKRKLSGSEYRKKRKRLEELNKKQSKSLENYVVNSAGATFSSVGAYEVNNINVNSDINVNIQLAQTEVFSEIVNSDINLDIASVDLVDTQLVHASEDFSVTVTENRGCNIEGFACEHDFEDPNKWPTLNEKVVQLIVEKGPIQVKDFDFPFTKKRKFSVQFYHRSMKNRETISRPWLIYSKSKDAVFCFCCILFSKNRESNSLSSTGYRDWAHLGRLVKEHENNLFHMTNFKFWKDLELGLKTGKTVDSELQKNLSKETEHWRNVLKRLIIFVQFLGSQSLAFRGNSDALYDSGNGNFLKLVEAVAKFDLVLAEHLRRIKNQETHNKYLSKDIQNELIDILSNAVRKKILGKIKRAKYYSIIVDCTPDVSRKEQLSLVIRIVDPDTDSLSVREYFLGFLVAQETTGAGLTELVLNELTRLDIPLENCRGQGYDNGANMKGKHSGMQARVRSLEPRAFYVPCSCHSVNLVITDAAHCSSTAVAFFGTVESLYVYFSGSVSRWQVLKKYLTTLTLKPLCETRWESRIDAIRPLAYHLEDIYEALVELSQSEDPKSRNLAESLGNKITEFKFICCIAVWHEILEKINIASKYLQQANMCLETAVEVLHSTKSFLIEQRTERRFLFFLEKAKSVARALEVPCNFPAPSELRSRRKKTHFSYESTDESILDPQNRFKVEFYYKVLDQAISSISERFEQINEHNSIFKFMYNIGKIEGDKTIISLEDCMKLEEKLTYNDSSDISGSELFEEIKMLGTLVN